MGWVCREGPKQLFLSMRPNPVADGVITIHPPIVVGPEIHRGVKGKNPDGLPTNLHLLPSSSDEVSDTSMEIVMETTGILQDPPLTLAATSGPTTRPAAYIFGVDLFSRGFFYAVAARLAISSAPLAVASHGDPGKARFVVLGHLG